MNTSNLKKLRKNARLTQEDLAEHLNVTRQTVAKWETGESVPDIDSCIAMSKLYNITVDDLVSSASNTDDGNAPRGKHMFGVLTIQKDGSVQLPQRALDVFGLSAGDKLMLLGDESQGMALVKASGLKDLVRVVVKAFKNAGEDIMDGKDE